MIKVHTAEEWEALFGPFKLFDGAIESVTVNGVKFPAEGVDPSLSRVEPDPRCACCGHAIELHDPRAADLHPSLTCLYHDSEGPCLCEAKP
jgi:hypothetical protein